MILGPVVRGAFIFLKWYLDKCSNVLAWAGVAKREAL